MTVLDDKYLAAHGRAPMSGIQALVRLVLEQARLDADADLSGAGLGLRQLPVLEVLDPALLLNVYCLHVRLLARL